MATILLVDDDNAFRMAARTALVRAGHDVRDALNGSEALRYLARFPTDLVVLDVIMPEKDGIETLIELRRLNPRIQAMVVSGGGSLHSDVYLKIAMRLGADRVLAKPCDHLELIQAVQSLLDLKTSSPDTRPIHPVDPPVNAVREEAPVHALIGSVIDGLLDVRVLEVGADGLDTDVR